MDQEQAQTLLAAITAVAAVVWLAGLSVLLRAAQLGRTEQPPALEEAEGAVEKAGPWLSGSAEVAGTPRELADKAAAILARGDLGVVKITDKSAERIRFERLNPGVANQPEGRWYRRGEIRFTVSGHGRTLVDWAAQAANAQWLLWLGVVFQLLGLVALIAGCSLIYTHIASAAEPAVRWQTLQMLQVSHFLWPPFLCSTLYRRGLTDVAAQFEALANNLPHYAA